MLFDIIDKLVLHVNRLALRPQQHMVLARGIAQLEEEFCLARMLGNDLTQLLDHAVIHLLMVGNHRNRNTVDRPVLDGLEQFHIGHLQFFLGAIAEARRHLACDIDSGTNNKLTIQVQPVLAKEYQFARTVEVLKGDDTPWLVVLAEARLHSRHDATQGDILAVVEGRTTVGQLRTSGISEVVEHNMIFVQGVSRQIDAHQVALFVQTLDIAPALIGLGDRRRGNLHIVESTKE